MSSEFSIVKASRPPSKRLKKLSIVGTKNPNWKGGIIWKAGRAYLNSPSHPRPAWGSYVQRSRLVMENILGRILRSDEIVHHINRDCSDDRVENLQLMTPDEHNHCHTLAAAGKWAKDYACCVKCARTDRRHAGNGLCTICKDRQRWPEKLRRLKERRAQNAARN